MLSAAPLDAGMNGDATVAKQPSDRLGYVVGPPPRRAPLEHLSNVALPTVAVRAFHTLGLRLCVHRIQSVGACANGRHRRLMLPGRALDERRAFMALA